MREIEFRGKRIDNGKWIYGWLRQTGHQNIEKSNEQYIRTEKYYQIQDDKYNLCFVDSETIGQYTGLKDKKGKKIFEGDIVCIDKQSNIKGAVEYSNEFTSYVVINTKSIVDEKENVSDYDKKIEVIGNIYDNHEILEVEDE